MGDIPNLRHEQNVSDEKLNLVPQSDQIILAVTEKVYVEKASDDIVKRENTTNKFKPTEANISNKDNSSSYIIDVADLKENFQNFRVVQESESPFTVDVVLDILEPKEINIHEKPEEALKKSKNEYHGQQNKPYSQQQQRQQYQGYGEYREDSRYRRAEPEHRDRGWGGYERGSGFGSDEELYLLFEDPDIRRNFIKNVVLILLIQFAYSFGSITVAILIPDLRIFVARNQVVAIVCSVISLILMIVLLCYRRIRQFFPLNLILLGLFTITFSYMILFFVIRYETYFIFGAMGITLAVSIVIFLAAVFLPCDMTKHYMYFVIGGCVLSLFIICVAIVSIFYASYIMMTIYSAVMAFAFSMYLWFDIQRLMGGKMHHLAPDEYICGAICIYIDVMYLFLMIAQLLGRRS